MFCFLVELWLACFDIIYKQVDGTYTYNLESLVPKVCATARENGEEQKKQCLRASSLQCLSAMVIG